VGAGPHTGGPNHSLRDPWLDDRSVWLISALAGVWLATRRCAANRPLNTQPSPGRVPRAPASAAGSTTASGWSAPCREHSASGSWVTSMRWWWFRPWSLGRSH